MNKKLVHILTGAFLLLNLSFLNCKATNPDEFTTGINIPDKTGMTVKGQIVDNLMQPLTGVVVNDGKNFTTTDHQGFYYLPSDLKRCKLVSISIPSNIEIGNGVVTNFFSKLSDKESVNRRDFKLNKRNAFTDDFSYIAMSDPQVRTSSDVSRLESETLADLKKTIQQSQGKNFYVMTLGDNVFDKMDFFPWYKSIMSSLGVPFFLTIGNHDFNLLYSDLHNSTDTDQHYAEETYESYFGPVDYSFNVGKVHIISMKNIDYMGGKKYKEQFTPEQLEWLKKDLSFIPQGSTVFLNLHAPTANKSEKGNGNTRNAAELFGILKNYNVHIFAGHTHFYENEEPTNNIFEHNIGAACGAWWAGEVNRCGAPNGYLMVNVKGDDIKWHYKATGREADYQFRVYKPGEFDTQSNYIVANVWDWDTKYQVRYYEDGKLKGNMEQFDDEDQDYISMKKGKATGYHTLHLFRSQPSTNVKEVKIEVINRFGEKFTQTIQL